MRSAVDRRFSRPFGSEGGGSRKFECTPRPRRSDADSSTRSNDLSVILIATIQRLMTNKLRMPVNGAIRNQGEASARAGAGSGRCRSAKDQGGQGQRDHGGDQNLSAIRGLAGALVAMPGSTGPAAPAPNGRTMNRTSHQTIANTTPARTSSCRSGLLELDQRAAEVLGVEEQDRPVVGADLGRAVAENARACATSRSRAARMSSTS